MKKIKKASESEFWQIVGLLALAKKANEQLKYIEEAIGDTLGIDTEEILGNSGYISDAIYGENNYNAHDLLKKMDIELP
jgi:hypothetical protein